MKHIKILPPILLKYNEKGVVELSEKLKVKEIRVVNEVMEGGPYPLYDLEITTDGGRVFKLDMSSYLREVTDET